MILNLIIVEAVILFPLAIYTIFIGIQSIKKINLTLKNKGRSDLDLLVERKNLIQMSIGAMILLGFAITLTALGDYRPFSGMWLMVDLLFILTALKSFKIIDEF